MNEDEKKQEDEKTLPINNEKPSLSLLGASDEYIKYEDI